MSVKSNQMDIPMIWELDARIPLEGVRANPAFPTERYPSQPSTSTAVFRCYCVLRMKVLDFVKSGGFY